MRKLVLTLVLIVVGCDAASNSPSSSNPYSTEPQQTLREARAGFITKIVKSGESYGPPDSPTGSEFELAGQLDRLVHSGATRARRA